jgi:hypothetical protein
MESNCCAISAEGIALFATLVMEEKICPACAFFEREPAGLSETRLWLLHGWLATKVRIFKEIRRIQILK